MVYWRKLGKCVVGCGVLVGLLSAHPVVAELSLQTSFNVSGTYTDNLFFQNENAEEDFGTLIGPDITLLFENPDIVIGATYTGRVSLNVNYSVVEAFWERPLMARGHVDGGVSEGICHSRHGFRSTSTGFHPTHQLQWHGNASLCVLTSTG